MVQQYSQTYFFTVTSKTESIGLKFAWNELKKTHNMSSNLHAYKETSLHR